jgi:hypothetical protein
MAYSHVFSVHSACQVSVRHVDGIWTVPACIRFRDGCQMVKQIGVELTKLIFWTRTIVSDQVHHTSLCKQVLGGMLAAFGLRVLFFFFFF